MSCVQAELAKLSTMLADKEKELKVTQKDLEAQKDEGMRITAELESRDGASLDLEVRTSVLVMMARKMFRVFFQTMILCR